MKNKIVMWIIIALLLLSLVANIVLLLQLRSSKIMSYVGIGAAEMVNAEVTELYIASGWNPYREGTVNDPELAQKLLDTLRSGCYQEAPDFPENKNPGDGAFPWFRIETDGHTYSVAATSDRIRFTVDGESKCYYTNIGPELMRLIKEGEETYLAEEN